MLNDPRVVRALESIASQELRCDLEAIVIDGGSCDGTLEKITRHRNFIDVLVSEPDSGIYDAMNKGIGRATGDVIGILNADDRYFDSRVLESVRSRLERTGADICYGNIVYEDSYARPVRYWRSGPSSRLKWRPGLDAAAYRVLRQARNL